MPCAAPVRVRRCGAQAHTLQTCGALWHGLHTSALAVLCMSSLHDFFLLVGANKGAAALNKNTQP